MNMLTPMNDLDLYILRVPPRQVKRALMAAGLLGEWEERNRWVAPNEVVLPDVAFEFDDKGELHCWRIGDE